MKKTLLSGKQYFHYFSLIALVLFPLLKGSAQVSLATLGAAYTQNFNSLANSGTSSTLPTGWAFSEAGGNALYTAGTGSGNSGDTYSFGATSNSERAFGTLRSGSVVSTIGASFVNNTGSVITSLEIAYTGEEWRLATAGRTDQLTFEYSLNATSLTTGSWTSVSALNFITPATGTPTGAVNGNLTTNQSALTSTISSLSIATGGTVWIRWVDVDVTGSDDGLGIDDFSLTPTGNAPVPPTHFAVTGIIPSTPVAGSSFSVVVQSQDGTNTPQNVTTATGFNLTTNGNAGAIGGTVSGTIPLGANSVTVTGVTLSSGGTGVNITATQSSGMSLTSGTSSNFTVTGLATQLAFVGVPSAGYVSTALSTFTVEARRADNTVDVNYNGTVIVSKASGPGTLSGTTSTSAVNGIATFSTLQFDQVGVYTLNTTSGTLTPTTSSGITISPAPVTWNFNTANPSAGVPVNNLSISSMSQGNNLGSTTFITGTSTSSGYTGASGNNNGGATARTTAFSTGTNGSAYVEFTLTPDADYYVTLNGISFGTRSTNTGPQAYSLRSSKDSYGSDLATGTIPNSSTWVLRSSTLTPTSSKAGDPITFRLYGHGGAGSPSAGTANWRIDDFILDLSVQQCVSPTITVNSGAICTGNSFTITPNGGVSYTVTGGTYTVSPTANTDYTVTGSDNIGCLNTAVSSVTVNALPNVSVNSGAFCTGSSFTMNPTGAVSYVYSGGSNVVAPTVNTDYTVTGTDANGCSNTAVSSVSVNALPTVTISGTSTVCAGYSTTLTAGGANTYVWSNGPTTAMNVVSPSTNTSYTVTGTDGNGCSSTANVNVTTSMCVPNTSLQAVYCGTTLTTLSDRLKCNIISGAAKYEWQVTDVATNAVYVIQSANNLVDMYLSYIPQVTYNKTYSIRVRAYSGGIWGTFGNACSVTTPVFAATKLQTVYCGTTLTTLSDRLKCDVVPNTTKYEWEVTDIASGTPYLIQSTGNTNNVDMYLSYIPQVTYNKSYSIRVRAYSAGIWGTFGTSCTVTTPASAITKLQAIYCSTTLTTLNDRLKCEMVPSTTKYEWEVTDLSTSAVYLKQSAGNTNNVDMYLSYIPQVTYNNTYSIRVRAYSGNVWSPFGPSCNISTPSMASRADARIAFTEPEETTEIEHVINVNTYPNPTSEILNINFEAMPENASIEMYNMVGELILTQPLIDVNNTINTSSLANGLYFTKILSNNKLITTQKIVKH